MGANRKGKKKEKSVTADDQLTQLRAAKEGGGESRDKAQLNVGDTRYLFLKRRMEEGGMKRKGKRKSTSLRSSDKYYLSRAAGERRGWK